MNVGQVDRGDSTDGAVVGTHRVTLVTSSLEGGGIARVVSIIANYWASRGWCVTVTTFDPPLISSHYSLNSTVLLRTIDQIVNSRGKLDAIRRNLGRIHALRHAIVESRPDVVISFGDVTNVLSLLACMFAGLPVIVSERIDPRRHDIGRTWSMLRRVSYPLASTIVVQTTRVLDALPESLRRKSVAIPNPIPVPTYLANPNEIQAGGPVVVAMGRLNRQKGFDLLIEAFAQVCDRNRAWTLVIWGEGPERENLQSLSRRLGLGGRVRFAGRTADPESELARSNLFVLSSRYEGFPNALCEAMAVGLPVVATDCDSGPGEIVRPGVNGLLVPTEDVGSLATAMDGLMSDPDLRRRFGAEARNIVDVFSVSAVMNAWEALLPCSG